MPRSTLARRGAPGVRLPFLLSLCKLVTATPMLFFAETQTTKPIAPKDPAGSPEFIFKLGLSVVLVLAGGVFAG